MTPQKVRDRRSVSKKRGGHRRQETSAVIEAMRNLRPSGEKSFEALIAQLFSRLSGTRIRLCKAGTQGGIDAIAETPFAIEDKRYKDHLDTGLLVGGLTRASRKYPHLQLWVLVATCEIGVQTADELMDTGLKLGIAVLILDAGASKLELGVSGLAAVAATDIETTSNILADPLWRAGGRKPDLPAIQKELEEIRNHPAFDTWKERIRRDLSERPTWSYLVRRHNESLRSWITRDALNAFQTRYDPSEARPRAAEDDLTHWLGSCTTSEPGDVAVVTGDRGAGKTWLIYGWLIANLHHFSLPVFFFSSQQVKDRHGEIYALILEQSRDALGTFGHNADAIIVRQKLREAGKGPWCVIILDAANEYETATAALGTAILLAMPPEVESFQSSPDAAYHPLTKSERYPQRQSALLVTCRTEDFERDSTWLGNRKTHRVRLDSFDSRVFDEAVEKPSVVQEQSEQFDDSARHENINAPTEGIARSLEVMESEGIVTRQGEAYIPNPEMLASGMGELIRRKLRAINASELAGTLGDVLEPYREDNQRVRWLRAAVTTSIVAGDAAAHPKVVDYLISEWLSSQDVSQRDLDELKNLTPLLIDPVLQLTASPTLLSSDALTLVEPIIHDATERHMTAVTVAVRKWFRLCPTNARWYLSDEHKAVADIANAAAEPSLTDLGLLTLDSEAIRELQRLGLYLADVNP